MFCCRRTHKHNAVDIWKSGNSNGECSNGQPLLDEPNVPAAGPNIRQWPWLLHNDTTGRWRCQQWTGKHIVFRVVGRRPPWPLPSTSHSSVLSSRPSADTDSVPTPAACRRRWSGRGSDGCQQIHRATIVTDCCFWNHNSLTSSVYCQCAGPFCRCTLTIFLFLFFFYSCCFIVSCSCQWRVTFYIKCILVTFIDIHFCSYSAQEPTHWSEHMECLITYISSWLFDSTYRWLHILESLS